MYTLLNKRRKENETGSAILLFLMVSIILGSILVVMAYGTIAASNNTTTNRDVAIFDIAARTALNDALRVANNASPGESIFNHIGPAKARTGTLNGIDNVTWEWYMIETPNTIPRTDYQVFASGYGKSKDPSRDRKLIGHLQSIDTLGARWVNNTVYYRPTQSSVFSWGMFGSGTTSIGQGTTITSYDSFYGGSKKTAAIGTNGRLNLPTQATIDRILLAATSNVTTANRCTGQMCASTPLDEMTYGMDLTGLTETVNNACAGVTLKTATGNSITLDPRVPNCFKSINLSGNVTINHPSGHQPSTGRPAKVYVTEDITFSAGTKFNVPQTNANSVNNSPTAIIIYSSGNNINIGANGANAGTDVRALIASSKADCRVGVAGNNTKVYGALVCGNTLTVASGVGLYWDEQTKSLSASQQDDGRKIWEFKAYTDNG